MTSRYDGETFKLVFRKLKAMQKMQPSTIAGGGDELRSNVLVQRHRRAVQLSV